jgi:hypothetical protein
MDLPGVIWSNKKVLLFFCTGIYLPTYLPIYLPMYPTTSLTHVNHARGWVWFLVVVVLRALGREKEGAWVWVG